MGKMVAYLRLEESVDPTKKKDKLLHYGATQLLKMWFTRRSRLEGTENSIDEFEQVKGQLTECFSPGQNFTFDGHVFRDIRRTDGEEFSKLILRSRLQLSKCRVGMIKQILRRFVWKDEVIDCLARLDLKKRLLQGKYTLCSVYDLWTMRYWMIQSTLIVVKEGKSYKENETSILIQDEWLVVD